MNCKIDFKQLMDEKFNDMLLNLNSGDKTSDETSKRLVQFANKYNLYGTEAMNFITDLLELMADLFEIQNKNTNKNKNTDEK